MPFLIQVVAAHPGPTWQSIALLAVGGLEALGMLWLRSTAGEIKQQRDELTALRNDVTKVATHVGTDGNGLLKRLEDLSEEMRELRAEIHKLAVQMAGQRGKEQP